MRLRKILFAASILPLLIAILGFGFLNGVTRLECYQHSDDGYCLSGYRAPFYQNQTRFRLSQIQAVELKEYVSSPTPGQRSTPTISYGVVLRTNQGDFALTSYSSTNKAEMQAQIDTFQRFLNDPQHPPIAYESGTQVLGYSLAIGFGLATILLIVLGIYLPGPNNNW